ncbi:MAG: hypothetical protein RQ864_12230 [Lutibacter sp.]|nr:hypothetical protein [Lutibacter sp.]
MNTKKIILINASKIYFGIVLFFFLMKFLNLEQITEFRLLNFIFVFWGSNNAIKKNIFTNHENDYVKNLYVGFATSFLAIILLGLSLNIYLSFIDPTLISTIENLKIWGSNLNPILITFAILIEGISSSLICTFILMQYWKKYKTVSPN